MAGMVWRNMGAAPSRAWAWVVWCPGGLPPQCHLRFFDVLLAWCGAWEAAPTCDGCAVSVDLGFGVAPEGCPPPTLLVQGCDPPPDCIHFDPLSVDNR